MSIKSLAVGDRIKDNDPRTGGNRVLVISEVSASRVVASRGGLGRYPVSILKCRIYTDGKPRRSGFSRIER